MSQQLDIFNLKYQRLCEALRERLEEVGEEAEDPDIKVRKGCSSWGRGGGRATVFSLIAKLINCA